MSDPAPTAETIILIDDETVHGAIVRAVKSGEPSLWTKLKRKCFADSESGQIAAGGGSASEKQTGRNVCPSSEQQTDRNVCPTAPWNLPEVRIAEIAPNGTGFTRSRRFAIGEEVVNLLLIKPEDGQLFGWLTLAEFHQRHGIKRVLCISRALSLREDLHSGDIALVTQASALPYPALYASRAPEWQDDQDAPREAEHYFLSNENLALGRDIAGRALAGLGQKYIPEVHTGYARHPAWGGGMTPWAGEQLDALRAAGLEMISEIAVGVCDFAARMPAVPVVCFNIIAGRARELAAGELAVDGTRGKDLQRYALYSPNADHSAVAVVCAFLREC